MEDARPERLFVGVGIDHYDAFEPLEAVAEVHTIGELLTGRWGYQAIAIEDVSDAEAEARLKQALPRHGLTDGALVLLWAGHGEPSIEGVLRLITRNAERNDTPTRTAAQVASWAGRSGARQILLMFDTCYSGGGVISAAEVVNRLIAELPDPKPLWVGILASAQEYQRARDGAFAAELTRILTEGPRTPELHARFNPFNRGVSGIDVLLAVVSEWTAAGHTPYQLNMGVPEMMFPNPLWDPGASEHMVEHLLLAAEGRSPEEEGIFFTGRDAQLATIVEWFAAPGPGVLVVTGPAGAGKSAIAGRLVSLSDPDERRKLAAAGGGAGPDPGPGSVHAHVHARRLTADRVAALLDDQLCRGGMLQPTESPRNRHELLGALLRLGQPVRIVIDGLDEAETEAWTIAAELITPLGRLAHVLVATRELTRDDRSLVGSLATLPVIDLGDNRWAAQTVANVRDYVRLRLEGLSPVMDPQHVADYITGLPKGPDQGLFLLARVITTQLRADPVDTTQPGWTELLAASVEQAFDRDLAQVSTPPPDGGDPSSAARAVLAALAWGFGGGLPDDVWAEIATALAPSGTAYGTDDVYWVLTVAGRYVLTASGGDRAVYRLSHQLLADRLHPPRRLVDRLDRDPGTYPVAQAVTVYYRRLLEAGRPADSHRYLWRYAWMHCADAGAPGIGLLRRLSDDYPAFGYDLALALTRLGSSYREVGRLAEATSLTEEAVARWRDLAAGDPTYLSNLASSLSDLGVVYRTEGRLDEAATAAEEAVARARELAQDEPALLSDLAAALSELGIVYGEAGRAREAVTATEEAAGYLRQLSADAPVLAGVLSDLSALYRSAGRLAEAVTVAEDAVERLRAMDAGNAVFLPGLAMALTNLGLMYRETGRLPEAIPLAEEAAERNRVLAADNPAYLPLLALTLTNLSAAYAEAGRLPGAILMAEEATGHLRDLATGNPAHRPGLAMALTNLGALYGHTQHLPEAIAAAEEAAERYRDLASNPAHLPGLAMALTSLGALYAGAGRILEAVSAAEEAVRRFRDLADNPAHLPGLARALFGLGTYYREAGHLPEAIPIAEEATELSRELAVGNPAQLPILAGALTSLGAAYQGAGRLPEAVAATEEAAERYRDLAADNPAHLAALAITLTSLGRGYQEAGRLAEAIPIAEEAVERSRELPAGSPGLPPALSILGTAYHAAGRLSEAITVSEEAVERYRALAADNPAHLPGLAGALYSLGNAYRDAGQLPAAIAVAADAAERWRPLAATNPAYLPGLAGALTSLGLLYRLTGRVPDAVAVADDVVARWRQLAAASPAHLPGLAISLSELGALYREAGRLAEAVTAVEEAAGRWRQLAVGNPGYLVGLAGVLNDLGTMYRETGWLAEAVPIAEEATERYRDLAGDNPAHLPGLAGALNNLGSIYEATGRLPEAVPLAEEATGRYRDLAAGSPAHLPGLAAALINLSTAYQAAGRLPEAVPLAEEATGRYRDLAADNPAHLADLAMTLNNLGAMYREAGRAAEASSLAGEAARRYRDLATTNPVHLTDLARALTNLGRAYHDAGRDDDAEKAWEEYLASAEPPVRAELLFYRAFGREVAATAVADLRRAGDLIEPGDLDLTGQLHDAARSCRADRPADFDAVWQAAAGEVPGWLTIDPEFVALIRAWVTTPTYAAAYDFVTEHGAALLGGETDLALGELNLLAGNAAATDHEREILAAARDRGFAEVYRPFLARELAHDYLDRDLGGQLELLRERGGEFRENQALAEALEQQADEDNAGHQIGRAAAELAKGGLLERALDALEDRDRFAALATELARGADHDPVTALAWLMTATTEDAAMLATAMFFAAVVLVLAGQADAGADQLREARRTHEATVQGLVPTLLQLTAVHPELANLAPVFGEPT